MRLPFLRLPSLFAVLAAAALAACPGTKKSSDGGVDSGPSAPTYCDPQGSPCTIGSGCCGNLTCQSGTCQATTAPTCAAYGSLCSETIPCCSPAPPTGGWPAGTVPPNLGCLTTDAGVSVCFIGGQVGDACGPTKWGCTNGLVCEDGGCAIPASGQTCPSDRDAGNCLVGDDCSAYANDIYCQGTDPGDPCQNWGLNCEQTAQIGNTCPLAGNTFTCMEPEVYPPPEFPLAAEALSTYSVCTAGQSVCQPNAGDTAQPICGSFFLEGQTSTGAVAPASVPVCVEACTGPDDCGSLAWDCIANQCVPNYCYAQADVEGDDIAGALTQAQPNAPVSANINVLFQPCAHGGPNTVCLPQNDNNWNTTTGICYRVGGPNSGGVGASCDPSGVRSDLGGLCKSGTLCFKGTCLPWCDTGNQTVASCAKNQQCVAFGGSIPTTTANANGTGVCTEDCDPYLPAAQNQCPQASGQPPAVCKPSGVDNDFFPSPGVCVGGSTAPIAIGQTCSPYGWLDPCVSGAVCALNKAGNGFACGQICDPQPSPNVTEPSCPSGQTCTQEGPPICENDNNSANDYQCYHIGVCL